MIVNLSDLDPAIVPEKWDELTAIVLRNENEVLIVRTPSDDREELEQVATAFGDILGNIPYLIVPYSLEILHFRVRKSWWKRVCHKAAAICRKFVDIIFRRARQS